MPLLVTIPSLPTFRDCHTTTHKPHYTVVVESLIKYNSLLSLFSWHHINCRQLF
uniref:Uncharacterized protein n=1 Tax=Octopus bimaculoides TaxID=37653 RepID=A0A0L8G620_OCTBM